MRSASRPGVADVVVVQDVMGRWAPVVVSESTSVSRCFDLMASSSSRHVAVLGQDGKLLALVSEHELRRYTRRGITELPVGRLEVALCACRRGDDVLRVLARQLALHRDATVVVDDAGSPIGLLTDEDAMKLARICLPQWTAVSDVIKPNDAPVVAPTALCGDVVAAMQKQQIRHVLVMDGRKLLGSASWRQMVGNDAQPVSSVLGFLVPSISGSEKVSHAVPRLLASRSDCLPVLDGRSQLMGLLTPRDIVRALASQLISMSTRPSPERR